MRLFHRPCAQATRIFDCGSFTAAAEKPLLRASPKCAVKQMISNSSTRLPHNQSSYFPYTTSLIAFALLSFSSPEENPIQPKSSLLKIRMQSSVIALRGTVMAATNSELEPILPSRNTSARYDSLGTGSLYPAVTHGPESEGNCANRRPPETDNSFSTNLRNRFRCLRDTLQNFRTRPTSLYVSRYFVLSCLALLLWGNTFIMVGNAAGPSGQLFRIGVLGVAAYLAGSVVHTIGLPPLLGMLLMGTVLRNTRSVVISGRYLALAADLRKVALVIILIRAGLGLDPNALKRLSGMVIRLAVIPSLVEASSVAVMSHFLLGLPWIWGCLLGAVMAAVSPAVVIPCLFSLQDRGYGKSKGIPTLVIAAATFDDVIAISAFSVVLSIIFSTGDIVTSIIQGPLGLLSGFIFGILWGLLIRYVPERHDRFVVILRTLLLGGGGLLLLFGSEAVGYDGAGPLGCVVAAFVANHSWRTQGWADESNPVAENFAVLWSIFQPLLFGLIGNEIDFYFLDLKTVGLGVACLSVSLAARILISVVAASGGNLTLKEKLFVSWAWFPKATVQAAIGPVALDIARKIKSVEDEVYASKLLIVAVLAILITAPVGATLITVLGPRLLEKEEVSDASTSPENQSSESVAGRQTTDFC